MMNADQDDHLMYRPSKEINYWRKRDVLNLIQKSLKIKFTDSNFKKIEDQIKKKINDAFNFAEQSNFPKRNDYKLHVFKK